MFSPQSIILKRTKKYTTIHKQMRPYARVTVAAFSILLHFSQTLLPSAAKMLARLFALKEQCLPSLVQPSSFLNLTCSKTLAGKSN